MRRNNIGLTALLALLLLHACGCPRQKFPEWTAAPLGLLGVWERAPSVVVADLEHARGIGSEKITKPPWPSLPKVVHVYWCEGELKVYATVKGNVGPDRRKFLWGQTIPGCDLRAYHGSGLEQYGGPMTRVWFVRDEGRYLRPAVDAGGPFCLTLKFKWNIDPQENPSAQFARLLLTPNAVADSPVEYAQRFFHFAHTACVILGKDQCTREIKALAVIGQPYLRREACDFLSSQFHEECPAANRALAPAAPRP